MWKSILVLLVGTLLVANAGFADGMRIHRAQAINPSSDGWHLAHSTEGDFSVELPGPFNDATISEADDDTYMLSAPDQLGSKFIAIYVPARVQTGIAEQFNTELRASKPAARFRSFPAIWSKMEVAGSDGESVTSALRFRTPSGIYVLLIVSPKSHEVEQTVKDRFFNSVKPSEH